MRPIDIICRKRDGVELSRQEIEFLISGYTRDEIPDYQMSAWLMAVILRGMTRAETAALTEAMLYSGEVLAFPELSGRKADKHSTGGVGDKTSLIIAPVAAAGGLTVPMISGRSLGHSGGTLDKLESIPGFNVELPLYDFRRILRDCGCSMIGQTAEIAPADKKIYELRDVTGTIDSPSLICASIMSKKLAEGIDALVLDVKTGSGAFMREEKDAVSLAELLVETGAKMGKKTVALITDMGQPLGRSVGNALEVAECIEVLRGGGPEDLRFLSIELCGWMFYLGERTASVAEGKSLAEELISSGKGLEKFRRMIHLQGGNPGVVDDLRRLPHTTRTMDLTSPRSGFIGRIACQQVGVAGILLGGGREKKGDVVDPAVGMVFHKKIGDPVADGEAILTIHYKAELRLAAAAAMLRQAILIEDFPGEPVPLIKRVIQARF
jgi:pyrimidine-nucleoside phosphorylase